MAASGRRADEILGTVPPTWGQATIKKVMTNAVMAGLPSALAPVFVAVMEAVLEEDFNLYGIQATTNPVAPMVVVTGPSLDRLGIAYGAGCLGSGFRANATLGRALRLALLNLGGGKPGVLDRATHGTPNKFASVTGEHAARCPWESYHEIRGVAPDEDAIHVVGITSLVNCLDHTSTNAEHLLMTMTPTIASVGSNTTMLGGPIVLLLAPEHATLLHEGGYTRQSLAEHLYEHAVIPASAFPPHSLEELRWKRAPWPEAVSGDHIRTLDSPSALHTVVTGGDGPHSLIGLSFGPSEVVTKTIQWP